MLDKQNTTYLQNLVGKVVAIPQPYKAILEFPYKGKTERSLLWADRLTVNGKATAPGHMVYEYLHVGSKVRFSCHTFNESGIDQCGWFTTNAIRQDPNDISNAPSSTNLTTLVHGQFNAKGIIHHVAPRQGVIAFNDESGIYSSCESLFFVQVYSSCESLFCLQVYSSCESLFCLQVYSSCTEQLVMFLGSKVYLFGKRLGSKQSLQTCLPLEDRVQFDAIPTDPLENDHRCRWFATAVWKGQKPNVDYDTPGSINQGESQNLVKAIKQLTSSPKATFLQAHGQMLSVLNQEFGVALVSIKPNVWESVLFHRSSAYLYKLCLKKQDLRKIFKEGDLIRVVGVAAPKTMMTQWVAAQVSLFRAPDAETVNLFQ
uniref:Uncharacterized protein n=1 Tax=Timema cristinae TaxID=61476 RepID=A0A7R9D996_TIMCR|nr:unnamed protein product [Timema cristinae]